MTTPTPEEHVVRQIDERQARRKAEHEKEGETMYSLQLEWEQSMVRDIDTLLVLLRRREQEHQEALKSAGPADPCANCGCVKGQKCMPTGEETEWACSDECYDELEEKGCPYADKPPRYRKCPHPNANSAEEIRKANVKHLGLVEAVESVIDDWERGGLEAVTRAHRVQLYEAYQPFNDCAPPLLPLQQHEHPPHHQRRRSEGST